MTDPLTQAEAALAKMRELWDNIQFYSGNERAGWARIGDTAADALPAFEAIVAELRERREAERWRPIAEAPHDLTEVLVWSHNDGVQVAQYEYRAEKPWWNYDVHDLAFNQRHESHPTHFRPLPQPPETDDE